MSGTLNVIYNTISYALHVNSEALANLQEQTATGSRVNRSSDDSSSAYQILRLNSQERSLQNYADNLAESMSTMEMSLSIVEEMISVFSDVRVEISQVASGVYSDEDRTRTATAINDKLEQIVTLVNTRHADQYLFGGGDTSTAPYTVTRTNGEITGVTYQGGYDVRNIDVAPSLQSSAYYVGDDIFRADSRSAPTFFGSTGAAAGSGTSSVRGYAWLTVTHDGSNYKLSIDDGATEVTVPGAGDVSNLAVTSSVTGQVLYVDATNITSTGVDMVSISGTYDIFNSLISIRDILRNEKGVAEDQLADIRHNAAGVLEQMDSLLVTTSVSMGSKIGFLEGISQHLENLEYNTEDETARLEDANIAEISIELARREVLYEMSLLVAADLMSMSILEYL